MSLADVIAGGAEKTEHLARCRAALDDPIAASAFTTVFDDVALATGPLGGTVCAVKNLIDPDASVVRRVRAAGTTLIGTTRADELGLGTFTPGVVNPWDAQRTVGGSSGGSAVAVARGAADFALATDTAGSARIPAACAGVAGLCLGRDWQARDGVVGLSPMFDRLGLVAPTGADLALLWRALGGEDGGAGQPRVRVADPEALGRVDPQWSAAAVRAAADLAAVWRCGTVDALALPRFSAFGSPRAVVVVADASRARPDYEPVSELVGAQLATPPDDDARDAAATELDRLGAQLRAAVGDDVLVLPTLPSAPPRWDELATVDDQLRWLGRMTRLCAPVNSAGLVAASVPYGLDTDGLPIGVQLVAATDRTVLHAAAELSAGPPARPATSRRARQSR